MGIKFGGLRRRIVLWVRTSKAAAVHLLSPDPIRFMRDFASASERPPIVTIRHRPREGGGSLLLASLATVAFSQSHGYQYVHSPFTFVLYRPDSFSTNSFVARWNEIVPLSSIFPRDKSHRCRVICLDSRFSILRVVLGAREVAFHSDKFRTLIVHHRPDLWMTGLSKVRQFTWKTWVHQGMIPKGAESDPSLCRVHVRRDDINPTDFPDRFTSAAVLSEQIARVTEDYPNLERVVLHCSNPDEDLLALRSRNLELDFSDDPFDTFIRLATAGALVVAKSTFSICAGLMSQGAVFYPSQGTELPPSWKRLPESALR